MKLDCYYSKIEINKKHNPIKLFRFMMVLCLLLSSLGLQAQRRLIGMATLPEGGIYAVNEDGTDFSMLHSYATAIGPEGSLIESNGRLWGTATAGGEYDLGAIFSMNIDGSDYRMDYSFNGSDGSFPRGSLVESNGRLWGTTFQGGISNKGVLFSITTDGNDFIAEHKFEGTYGAKPSGNLIEANGKLWGMTLEGGASNNGAIFSLSLSTGQLLVEHDFNGSNGKGALSSLIEHNGKLWGVTSEGGTTDNGVIFSYDVTGGTYQLLHTFDGTNGYNPIGKLIVNNGKLWGTTQRGGSSGFGVIYSIDLNGSNYTVNTTFTGTNGSLPVGELIEYNNKFFGTTIAGGSSSKGVVFSLDTDGSNYAILYNFTSSNGRQPLAGLVENNGKLWGVTKFGGSIADYGVVFSINQDGSSFVKEHEFDYRKGKTPWSKLIKSNNRLWGMTFEGGIADRGVIFSMEEDGSDYVVEHLFDGTTGSQPLSNLVESNGRLWGTTYLGGSNNVGVLFSIANDGSDYTVEHNFDGTNGGKPRGDLLEKDGRFYSMTFIGGSSDIGVIFSIGTDGTGYEVEHTFTGANGSGPVASMIESNGKFWGMTFRGGSASGDGVIFSTATDGSNFNVEHTFSNTDGSNPRSSLIEYNGKLWSTTSRGGSESAGVIFSINNDGTGFAVRHSFDIVNGREPYSGVVESEGELWGVTKGGGINSNGIVYSFDPTNDALNKIWDFNNNSIVAPYGSLYIIPDNIAPTITSSNSIEVTENIEGTVYTAVATETVDFTLGNSKDESLFTLSTDAISFNESPDYEVPQDANGDNIYELEVIATDGSGNSANITLNITVTNIDDRAPTITSGSSVEVEENVTGIIYTATADETVDFILGGSMDEDLFTLSTDAISFTNSPDYEAPQDANGDNIYELEVIATDGAGNSSSITLNITVTNIDDTAPTITSNSSIVIVENVTGTVYTATANEAVDFTLGNTRDEDLFTLSSNAISFNNSPDYENPQDANGDNVYELELLATDGAGNISSIILSITVTLSDEIAPTITSATSLEVEENAVGSIYTATANETVNFTLGSSKDENFFTLSTDVINFTTAPDYESPQDANADNVYELDIIATDGSGNSASITLSITVTDVDERAPIFTSSSSIEVVNNVMGTVYTATADETVNFSLGSSMDEDLFTLATDAISFNNSPDYGSPQDANGDNIYELEVIATDLAGNSASLVLSITVIEMDDIAPTITSASSLEVVENVTGTIYLATANETVDFTLGSANDEGLFTLSTDVISFTNSPNYESPQDNNGDNIYELEIIATDQAGNSSSIILSITVADIDDTAPTITSSSSIEFEENVTGIIYTVTADETVVFSLGSSKDENLFTLATDAISFNNSPDFESPQDANVDNVYDLDVIATDGLGNSTSLALSVTITDVDEIAPSFTSAATAEVEENATGPVYTAEANEQVIFTLGTAKDEAIFRLSTDVISFKFAPDYESPRDANLDNVYELDVTATDFSGNSSTITVSVSVIDVQVVTANNSPYEYVSVYPNPASSFFKLDFEEKNGQQRILLFDLKGALIKSFKVNGSKTYPVEELEQGLYNIAIEEAGQQYSIGKLLINK